DFRRAIWGDDTPPPWGIPQVQPEQIRMYAFAALAAGYRGLGFAADAELTAEAGRARRYESALVKAEGDLVEALIPLRTDPIPLLPAFPPDEKPKITYNPLGNSGGMNPRQKTQKIKETKPHESVKVASITTKDGLGRVLLVADFATKGQFQPPQMALNE